MKIGDKAPDFTLPDKDGKEVSLSDYKGKKIILYFYPKDNTPGCTKQACNFRDNYPQITEKGAEVIGISKDGVKSHSNFAAKHELPFILLSDKDLEVIKMYDVWKEKKMFGKTSMGVVRTTFLIDEEGTIIDIMDGKRMKSTTNADDVIKSGFLE
ncbi:thioredoxin-dependent thiol peroxidase [Peptostreptococcus russellii]|uniref:thioredoxin-dependent peroxiredoxin n=1 Tax=Peptostreptococcus russellii TaxID=215200 RepID=A0A1H8HU34_9FIRM|nr:thioredoxin-dependent thiol peroxidase [Peptostreptococcus russellii]MBC2578501.1 thioredoxin-dependent thiol peroxidase [Peptostreptococcus russellii]SEN59436.1 peroxiredoxin Q/BCP [Peptostreptococcus russellii]